MNIEDTFWANNSSTKTEMPVNILYKQQLKVTSCNPYLNSEHQCP